MLLALLIAATALRWNITVVATIGGVSNASGGAGRRGTVAGWQANLDPLIEGLQKKYSRMVGIAASFTQLYEGPDGRTIRESGTLLLRRPAMARWDYVEPEKKIFVSDGKNIYFYVFGEQQATRASVKESSDPQIPFLFLLGRGNLRRDFSRIEVADRESPVVPGNIVLRLVPKRAPEEFKQVLAEVNPSTFQVKRLVILQRGGARMDFQLGDVRENHLAPPSAFTFVPPPGVVVTAAK